MTATTLPAPARTGRQTNILKLHWQRGKIWLIYLPLAFIAADLVACWLWASARDTTIREKAGWAFAVLFCTAVFYFRAAGETSRFVTGLGATRREYYWATVLFILGHVTALTTVVLGLTGLQQLTGNWGGRVNMFGSFTFVRHTHYSAWITGSWLLTLSVLTTATAFTIIGSAYWRWRGIGAIAASVSYVAVYFALAFALGAPEHRMYPEAEITLTRFQLASPGDIRVRAHITGRPADYRPGYVVDSPEKARQFVTAQHPRRTILTALLSALGIAAADLFVVWLIVRRAPLVR